MICTSLLALTLSSGVGFNAAEWQKLLTPQHKVNVIGDPNQKEISVQVLPGQFVAFQDGDAPWKVIQNDPKNKVQKLPVNDAAGRFSLFEGPDPSSKNQPYFMITHKTLGEIIVPEPPKQPQMGKIEGTISNLPKEGNLYLSSLNKSVSIDSSGKFTFEAPADKKVDLCFVHYPPFKKGQESKVDAILLERDVATNSNVKLDWAKAANLTSSTVTFSNFPAGMSLNGAFASFSSAGGGFYSAGFGRPGTATFECAYLPASVLQPSDYYMCLGMASSKTHEIGLGTMLTPGEPKTINIPQLNEPPAPTVAGNAPVRVAFPDIPVGDFSSTITTEKQGGPTYILNVSSGWLGSQTAYTTPDLHTLPGWQESFNLPKEPLRASRSTTQFEMEGIFIMITRYFTLNP